MHLKQVPAKEGYQWFRQGLTIFRRNPAGMLLTFFSYLLVVGLLSAMPLVGHLLTMLLVPAVSVGFMAACRDVLLGKRIGPLTLLSGLREHGALARRRLLWMGLVYLVCSTVVLAVAAAINSDILADVLPVDAPTGKEGELPSMWPIVLFMLLMIPVGMLFWFAPVLSAWHDTGVRQAIYISWLAVWRNRAAFVVYGLLWLALMLVVSLAVAILFRLLGGATLPTLLMIPFSLVLTTMLFCSFYATYLGCFEGPEMDGFPNVPA
ncbi:BPSS1780 family membrane protein [Chitinasiproducens palmae]|uniref:DUF7847 domain-containing protein n=1 Tax=Chitinasiproducens palmae TaxID=1770053 RepID=A0A1H2PSX3_9BURK|nr:BPSS1780 family membrane protein [Chitinasiproducens palmae]SDV50120.1 hypothetical protein SAMN05216551_110134 [Chitinasiproducens palmae]